MNSLVSIKRTILTALCALVLSILLPPLYAQEDKPSGKAPQEKESTQLIGKWEIYETKEPGKPYVSSYKGRPFVSKGANAFTLVLEYRNDGTFRRMARIGESESIEEGTWRLSGHELRHKRKGAQEEEIMYIRFDGKDHYVSTEVFEDTSDPGLFAKFKRI
ncbi:MAG: hypothetical protein QG663_368 [Thermodesulfobacteriota bacterium]|nr:hypothetical protein [Thermodesulfobacteriota bacterium]